jgi:hypothetical protein
MESQGNRYIPAHLLHPRLIERLNKRETDCYNIHRQPGKGKVQMKRARRSIVFSILTGAVIIALTAVGMGLWFFMSHHESSPVSKQSAEAEFSRLRSRFSTESPLIDMSSRQPAETSTTGQSGVSLHTFHTVIFDTRGRPRMVHITVPFWFARLFAGRDGEFKWLGQLTFLDDTEFDSEAIHLSLDQLEQWGPGLIVDYQHQSGGQFISWVE